MQVIINPKASASGNAKTWVKRYPQTGIRKNCVAATKITGKGLFHTMQNTCNSILQPNAHLFNRIIGRISRRIFLSMCINTWERPSGLCLSTLTLTFFISSMSLSCLPSESHSWMVKFISPSSSATSFIMKFVAPEVALVTFTTCSMSGSWSRTERKLALGRLSQ